MTYPATDKIDTITTCRLSPAVLKHREYRRELCLNSLNSIALIERKCFRPINGSEACAVEF